MPLEGFIPYDSKAAERYEKKRWWLGITLGDVLDKAAATAADFRKAAA